MKYINVFIASREAAKKEAQYVADKLGNYEMSGNVKIKPICWWDDTQYSHILTNLIQQTNDCDFAVILLTEDDLFIKDVKTTSHGSRDNCIFEAGLFAGAFSPDFERCFLLVSVASSKLPSDLGGIRYIDIGEFGKGADDEVKNKLEAAARSIGSAIDSYRKNNQYSFGWRANRGLKLPIITESELMQLERIRPEGHLRDQSTNVFVSSSGPLETNSNVAKIVITNMVAGDIEYRYVFQADTQKAGIIADVIASLVGVNEILRDGVAEPRTPSQNLETIRKLFRISFLKERQGFHYCIHNANQEDYAICYLRCPMKNSNGEIQFVEWCRGLEALAVAQEIIRMCGDSPEGVIRVFDSTVYYDLYNAGNRGFLINLRNKIIDKLTSRFKDITADMVSEKFFSESKSV